MSDDERLTERFEQIERNRTYEEAKEPEEDGICKRCKNERKSATEGNDYLCDGCFDFLNVDVVMLKGLYDLVFVAFEFFGINLHTFGTILLQ